MSNPHEYLNSFTNFETNLHKIDPTNFNLDRVKELLDLLDNPERQLKIVHVAGTKGKGSTAAFIASMLHQAGFKVGLYTSPHLHRVNERIRVLDHENLNSKEQFPGAISDESLDYILASMRCHIVKIINEGGFLTYFEVLTAVAMCYFVRRGVDIVILEAGLGGRLDATNTADAMLAVITPISLDHTKILGKDLAKIAAEKAGIIKHTKMQVVIAPQEKQAMDVLLARCHEFGITPFLVNPSLVQDRHVALKGAHQTVNAACALQAIDLLKHAGYKIEDEAIREGLSKVCWSGRFEVIQENPTVVVDCAHNAASAKALAQTVVDVYPYRCIILVLGVSSDKDVAQICVQLKDCAAQVILTQAKHPRAHVFSDNEAKNYFENKPWRIVPDLNQAIAAALKAAKKEDVILVTGSVFVVAQAMTFVIARSR